MSRTGQARPLQKTGSLIASRPMGFFDPPDQKVQRGLSSEVAARADLVRAVARAEGESGGLSYHHQRELEVVIFVAWLQTEIEAHGTESTIPKVTQGQMATMFDQAQRIGQHFTRDQGKAFDRTVRFVRANPEQFERHRSN